MDDNTLLQLEGYVESVVYRNEENGYTVVEISDDDDYITAVGIMPRVHQGDLLKLTGNYKEHPNYGRQFSAQAQQPHKGLYLNLAKKLLMLWKTNPKE